MYFKNYFKIITIKLIHDYQPKHCMLSYNSELLF